MQTYVNIFIFSNFSPNHSIIFSHNLYILIQFVIVVMLKFLIKFCNRYPTFFFKLIFHILFTNSKFFSSFLPQRRTGNNLFVQIFCWNKWYQSEKSGHPHFQSSSIMLGENMRMRVYINAKKVERSDSVSANNKISILRKLSGNFGNIAGINIWLMQNNLCEIWIYSTRLDPRKKNHLLPIIRNYYVFSACIPWIVAIKRLFKWICDCIKYVINIFF